MTPEDQKKWRRYAVLFGAALALACHLLPPDYRAVCNAIVSVCTGS